MIAIWVWLAASAAFGADCAKIALEPVEVAGIEALALRGVDAEVSVLGDEGSTVRITGTVCAGEARIALHQDGATGIVTVSGRKAEGVTLEIRVPRATWTVVLEHEGALSVTGVASLRAAGVQGSLAATDIAGPVIVDGVVVPAGSVVAR